MFEQEISNIPGKSFTALVVDYAPGGKSASHRHAASAFHLRLRRVGRRPQLGRRRAGQDLPRRRELVEAPGSHHRVSENASATEPARLLAIFVVDEDDHPLTTPDPD